MNTNSRHMLIRNQAALRSHDLLYYSTVQSSNLSLLENMTPVTNGKEMVMRVLIVIAMTLMLAKSDLK